MEALVASPECDLVESFSPHDPSGKRDHEAV
jgi:hypothetical protein